MSGPPIAVMLPLRIESRFDPGTLRIRVVPDDPWIAYHDDRAATAELDVLERAVAAGAAAADGDLGRLAFGELAGQVGGARAVWLIRSFVSTGPDGAPHVTRPPDAALASEPMFPRVQGLPDRLQVWLGRGGATPTVVLTLNVEPGRLSLEPPDRDAGERRWWQDWDEAVAAGLAGTIALPGDPTDIDILLVTGLSEHAPADLFGDHRDAGSLGLLAPGTPTNTVQGAPAASLATDPGAWWDVLRSDAGEGKRLVSLALTGDAALLGNLPGPDEPQRSYGESIVAGLWPALWGFAGSDVWAIVPGTADAAAWAPEALAPEGAFATLRVGAQPYGLLPATALARWRPASADPPLEAGLLEPLQRLRAIWSTAAEARGTVVGADTDALLALLGHVPTAKDYRHRRALPLELWWLSLLLLGFATSWGELEGSWQAQYALAQELGLDPIRRYGSRSPTAPVTLALVRPSDLAEGRRVGDTIERLVELALANPSAFSQWEFVDGKLVEDPLDSLLLRLVVRSLQVALGDVGRELAGASTPQPESIFRPEEAPGQLERWITSLTPAAVAASTPAALALDRVAHGLRGLVAIPEDRLARLLRATLDTAIYRIDPWLVALPARRLRALLDDGTPLRLGAYSWVDAPRPGTAGPTRAGLVHVPSSAQAVTAAVLRDRAVSDVSEAGRWHLDLTSRSVRAAQRVAQHVRAGAHVGEALGREVERVVAVPADVARLRRDFPLRTEHAGRRTCDGLAVLAADATSLGVAPAAGAGLAELRAAVDAYADLLVAEAVHYVTHSRPEAASAAMDAAAGLSRPPELEVIHANRQGTTVDTSVLILLRDVASVPAPAADLDRATLSPARLSDPSAASFVAQQIGSAVRWKWTVQASPSRFTVVTLGNLGLETADALALPLTDLERLVFERAAAELGVARDELSLRGTAGSDPYHRAARLVALLGRSPAGPDAIAADPDAASRSVIAADVDADLAARYERVRGTAGLLRRLLAEQLALTADGEIGSADPAVLQRLVVAARAWGIAPEAHPVVELAERCEALLGARLAAAPAGAPPRAELPAALTALVSATGQLAVLSRLPASELPGLARSPGDPAVAGLDATWLPVVAAVREPLARLEVHQLTAGTSAGGGPALTAWSSKPADPWQLDRGDETRLVVAYAAAQLDVSGFAPGASVAAAVVDRFAEVIPDAEQDTEAVFGFDAPASRPPQAILLAVPPDLGVPLDDDTLRDIVLETRALAHARMARPDDLGNALRGLLPSTLLPSEGRSSVPIV